MGVVLFDTYKRLFTKLNAAHMADDTAKIREVRHSLKELGETWQQVFDGDKSRKLKNEGKSAHARNEIK